MKTYKVELTEEFIKEAKDAACPEWKMKIMSLVPEAFESQLEFGKWYKSKDPFKKSLVFLHSYDTNEIGFFINEVGYGFNYRLLWRDKIKFRGTRPNELTRATHKEVEEALIKEAKKRGLVPGCSFKSHWVKSEFNNIIESYETKNSCIVYDSNENELMLENSNMIFIIFKDGIWAEPIENPTLKKIEEIEAELKQLKEKL